MSHRMNLALAPNGPFTMPPQPAVNGSPREAVKVLVDTLLSVISRGLITSSLNGGLDALLETQNDPSKSGVVLRFSDPSLIYGLLQRLNLGETIDPTDPLPETNQGCLAVYSFDTAPGMYEDAVSSAANRGLGFHDVVMCISTDYVDLAGEDCQLTSFCYNA